jgi:hypothetical protein
MLRSWLRRFRSVSFEGHAAVLCLPALGLTLGYGVLSGDTVPAGIAASGALSVGFGSVHAFTEWRWAAMVLAALGMGISALVGSAAGNDEILFLAVSALWAAGCAMFASIENGAWWIMLQWSIALVVAGFYPADLAGAAERALLVLAGGALQIVCVVVGSKLTGAPSPHPAYHSLRRVRRSLQLARRGKLPTARHAARAACSVALATGLVQWLAFPNGYWAPMTALLVLKPQLRATRIRGLERLVGTMVGGVLASLTNLISLPDHAVVALALVAAWLAYGLQRSDYIVFTVAITATIVFTLALVHEPETFTAWYRLLATALGGGLALSIAHLTNPHGPRRLRRRSPAGETPAAKGGHPG